MGLFASTLFIFFWLLLIDQSSSQSFTNCALKLAVQEVDCSDAGVVFTTVPQDAPVDTRRIVMTGNNITMLSPGLFTRYPNLTVLYLDRNQLSTLAQGWLSDLPALEELYLDSNPFTDLEDAVFSNLTSLRILSLKNNLLRSVQPEMLIGLSNLQMLFLDDNSQLSMLPVDSFLHLPEATLQTLSLTNNRLQTIPEGIFDSLNLAVTSVTLRGNPWSCDCDLEWFRMFLSSNAAFPEDRSQTNCQWPLSTSGIPIANHTMPFMCYDPIIVSDPEGADILTDRAFSLTCIVDGAPFPNITWLKDGQPVQYSSRVSHQLYNASLDFTVTQLEDAGEYQCVATNINGTASSVNVTLELTESTCFDGIISSHETDLDCGGVHCVPCNITQRCKADSDCMGNLLCLYAHQLPSQLLYISPNHPDALTCRMNSMPADLLETRIQAAIPTDILAFNFSVNEPITVVEDALRAVLTEQLNIQSSLITGGSPDNRLITTVERDSQPLIQLWPTFAQNAQGQQARQQLLQLVDAGQLKATIRLLEQDNLYRIRINL